MQVVKVVVGFDFASPHLPSLSPRHCSPLFCPPPAPHLSPAQNNLQKPGRKHKSDGRARADRSRGIVLSLPAAFTPGTYHFTPLTISSSARPFFAPELACRGIMEVEVRSAGCLSIHLTRQSSHLPLSEGFIMRGRPGRVVSKGGKDGKASLEKGLQ